MSLSQRLDDLVRSRLGVGEGDWLRQALSLAGPPLDRPAFAAAFAACGRRLGRSNVVLTAEERARLRAAGLDGPPEGWGLDEVGRAALLIEVLADLALEEHFSLVGELFVKGEIREKQAVLRVLAYLPEPQRFLDAAVEACRSHVQPIFEAIACENPYPAAFFPDASFNQMVLKAIFTGTAVERIVGFEGRTTPELVRMLEGYASERRAAGRPVPDDVARVTARLRRNP